MFAQLRRVVYLLVLLQCCACVAYANSKAQDAISDKGVVDIDKLIRNLKNDSDTDAEDWLTNISIDLYSLKEGVSLCNNNSLLVNSTLEEVKKLQPGSTTVQDKNDKIKQVVKTATEIINKTKDAVERTRLANRYCTQWLVFLKEVNEQVGDPTESDVKEIKGSSENDSTWMIISTYGELLALKGELHLATRWRNLSSLKNVEEQVKTLEEELKKLDSYESLKNEITSTGAAATESTSVKSFDEMFEEIKKKVTGEREKRVRQRQARKTPNAEAEGQNQQEAAEGSTANPEGGDSATTKVEPSQSEPQPRETSSSPESPQETSTTDGPTKETASTTKTDNGDTTTPITTTTTTAVTKTLKKKPQDAANAPMGNTAVLAVLALTVSTVIGMTVV